MADFFVAMTGGKDQRDRHRATVKYKWEKGGMKKKGGMRKKGGEGGMREKVNTELWSSKKPRNSSKRKIGCTTLALDILLDIRPEKRWPQSALRNQAAKSL